ncbi:hypothetical protein K438DRAFT_1969998 [Mycena galopus ATCC 62051]|nr:hypothetical protein K438DRAFT_1969998 [Mycena galopus ATCC 62051]
MTSVSPAEELELLQLIADVQTTNYLAAAGITVLVFEHISTFPEEVIRFTGNSPELTLRRSNSYGRAVSVSGACSTYGYAATSTDFPPQLRKYPQIRYFTLIVVAVDASSMFTEMKSSSSEMVNCTVVTISVDFVLVLRVWILYGKSRRLLYILFPLMAVEIIILITIGTLSVIPLKALPRYFTFYAVPSLVIAVLMFSMTLYKCSEPLYAFSGQRMPLITLFLKDGVILFLLILVFSIVELTIWNNARPTLAQVPIIPGTSLSAVVGARVLLNIKNLATEVNDITIPTIELSDISFRQRPGAAKARIPWYLQTGELSNSEVLSGELH